jgi:hypothetical protein
LLNSDIGRLETIIVLVCQDTDQFSIQSSEFIMYAVFERSRHFGTIEASTYEANHSRMNKIPNEVKITKNGVFRDINT